MSGEIGEPGKARAIAGTYREHFAKLEVGKGDRVSLAQLGTVLDAREPDVEVPAFDRRLDRGPCHLHEARLATQTARDHFRDFHVEAADARGVCRIGFNEWCPAFGVAAPAK